MSEGAFVACRGGKAGRDKASKWTRETPTRGPAARAANCNARSEGPRSFEAREEFSLSGKINANGKMEFQKARLKEHR